jgi:hypothetical protein
MGERHHGPGSSPDTMLAREAADAKGNAAPASNAPASSAPVSQASPGAAQSTATTRVSEHAGKKKPGARQSRDTKLALNSTDDGVAGRTANGASPN